MNSSEPSLTRQQIQNQFDRAATTYDSVAWLQRKMGDDLLKLISESDLPNDVPLIDLGCGTGELLRKLNGLGYELLTGLDLSAKMLDVSKEKTPTASFLHADIESIPAKDESFTGVVSNAAIQWCDPMIAVREIHRVLEPGGTVFLTAFISGTLAQWDQAFIANELESRVHSLPERSEIESAFQSVGLNPFAVLDFKETTSFGSIESMFASIKRLGATNAMASRAKRMSRKEYVSLRKHFADQLESKGKLELDFAWVQIVANRSV